MLILTIKKNWFEMIKNEEKKEEYREIKPYYDKRLLKYFEYSKNKEKQIILRNGYKKESPSIQCLCTLSKGTGKEKWGAIPNKEYYVLKILKIKEKGEKE